MYFTADYECDCFMKANKVLRNNDTYIHFEKIKFTLKIGQAYIHLDNLFGGDPILGTSKHIYLYFA